MSPFADSNMLSIDASEWDSMAMDSTLTAPLKNASDSIKTVYDEWTSDDDMSAHNDIMEVDEQIGSNFLSDDIFGHCASPVSAQEEFTLSLEGLQDKSFLAPPLTLDSNEPRRFPSNQHKAAYQKLAAMMAKSQETRRALKMNTNSSRPSIGHVVTKIEASSQQLRTHFGALR
eukprot:CAMPEP_0194044150 /NCGR_PEP_ID=MMETSP0009_2-20130614/15660_1 /TAXON_ID=210454 /ORGANISM="Grammatophora oceanica, Strain CCMP 410" /LENGTH=172 /DNA_ID=CAMNT_0038688583 /DNA_START=87 /DNA_END=605 /DNA_ORIENTATION=-